MPLGSVLANLLGRKRKEEPEAKSELDAPISKEGREVFAHAALMRTYLKSHRAIKDDDAKALAKSFSRLAQMVADTRYHRVGRLVLYEVYQKEVPEEWAKRVQDAQGRVIQALARTGRFKEVKRKLDVQDVKEWDGVLRAYVNAVSVTKFAPGVSKGETIDPAVVEAERQEAFVIDKCARMLLPKLAVQFQEVADSLLSKEQKWQASGRVRQRLYNEAAKALQVGQFQFRISLQSKNDDTRLNALVKLQALASNEDYSTVARLEMFYPDWEQYRYEGNKLEPKSVRPEALIQRWHTGVALLLKGEPCLYLDTTERLIHAHLESALEYLKEQLAKVQKAKVTPMPIRKARVA